MQKKVHFLFLPLVLILFSCKPLYVSDNKVDPNFHLYLLAGQSNMAGRGETDSLSTPNNIRILMLNEEDEWSIARDPLHFDKPKVAGVGPGLAFGQKMLTYEKDKDVKIGLIPCAVGGTSIDQWQDSLYDESVGRLRIALQYGVIKGIIWHQGESDSSEEKAEVYIDKLQKLIARYRDETGNDDLPFVAGELGYYKENYKNINNELKKLPELVSHTAVATSEGLVHKGDGTHLDSESARTLGERMAVEMHELQ